MPIHNQADIAHARKILFHPLGSPPCGLLENIYYQTLFRYHPNMVPKFRIVDFCRNDGKFRFTVETDDSNLEG